MQSRELRQYKERLLELRERLREDVRARLDRVPELLHAPGDVASLPTHAADDDHEGLDSEIAVGGLQIEELNEVNAALARIDRGEYGRCIACRERIGRSRLDAIPYTTYCVDCKSRREAGEPAPKPR